MAYAAPMDQAQSSDRPNLQSGQDQQVDFLHQRSLILEESAD
jgi:hypothetical protein